MTYQEAKEEWRKSFREEEEFIKELRKEGADEKCIAFYQGSFQGFRDALQEIFIGVDVDTE